METMTTAKYVATTGLMGAPTVHLELHFDINAVAGQVKGQASVTNGSVNPSLQVGPLSVQGSFAKGILILGVPSLVIQFQSDPMILGGGSIQGYLTLDSAGMSGTGNFSYFNDRETQTINNAKVIRQLENQG
jgi:hypothetical protein